MSRVHRHDALETIILTEATPHHKSVEVEARRFASIEYVALLGSM